MQDKYYKRLLTRQGQRIELLLSRPDFQEDVFFLRIKWKIPRDGLKNEDENQKWHRALYTSDDRWFRDTWSKARKELERLRKEKNFHQAEVRRKEINNSAPLNSFRMDVKNIVKKYKLPMRWDDGIKRYLLFNNKNNMTIPLGVVINTERDKDTDLEKLCIGIEDDTTLEDIKQSWPTIKYFQSRLNSFVKKKFQPIKMMERDRTAYELDRQGKSLKEIASILKRKYKRSFEWYEVSKFIERHRKKIGIN